MTIYSAGYGNRGFDAFLKLLRKFEITHLVDVRSVPQSSYWEDFRRERLFFLLSQTEIRYVYMGDTLGGVQNSPALCKNPESIDIEPLRHESRLETGLMKLLEAASDPSRKLLLMCGCLRPHKCHRSRLLGPALIARGVEYFHLDENGDPVTHRQVESESAPQATLF